MSRGLGGRAMREEARGSARCGYRGGDEEAVGLECARIEPPLRGLSNNTTWAMRARSHELEGPSF